MNMKFVRILKSWKSVKVRKLQENLQAQAQNDDDSYFVFETDSSEGEMTESLRSTRPEILMSKYLADPDKDISMLNRHPEIKQVFIKYNTLMPSSGLVDRLFSYATIINLPKSHKLSDQMFEQRVVLKTNISKSHHK
ncbi:unnamed protein product [Euphydryas editha]|uniref:Uncharacterized protein n=1 Tax=Euphydryas editha TaxID=104508 RepID=A0AAU9TXK7_EUPED|nr:unnamed protein product [Euphydryas editha]